MPHSRTILRASSVQPTRSFSAPVDWWPNIELLGDAPAEPDDQRVDDVLALVDVAFLERKLLGDAERHAGGQDRHLVERVGELEHVRAHRVTALVVRDDLLLLLRQRKRLALEAHQHAVARGVEVFLVHLERVAAHGEQRGFVHEVREVGAAHAGRTARDHVDAHVG